VTRANSSHAARKNLAALLHELGKNVGALVVDQVHLLDTKLADFFLAKKLTLPAARSSGTATWTTRSAFTASATTATWTAFAASAAAVPARAAMTAVATTRSAFTTRRWSRRRCLRSCWYWILFV